mmetsp:Transcript_42142/g.102881  ORF Transcript_42142/g.102881 Transcript_42142/m.102881 type:complete len:200 (-) Transcript_42142:201-800(-)
MPSSSEGQFIVQVPTRQGQGLARQRSEQPVAAVQRVHVSRVPEKVLETPTRVMLTTSLSPSLSVVTMTVATPSVAVSARSSSTTVIWIEVPAWITGVASTVALLPTRIDLVRMRRGSTTLLPSALSWYDTTRRSPSATLSPPLSIAPAMPLSTVRVTPVKTPVLAPVSVSGTASTPSPARLLWTVATPWSGVSGWASRS